MAKMESLIRKALRNLDGAIEAAQEEREARVIRGCREILAALVPSEEEAEDKPAAPPERRPTPGAAANETVARGCCGCSRGRQVFRVGGEVTLCQCRCHEARAASVAAPAQS